jgi:hypothetical protein
MLLVTTGEIVQMVHQHWVVDLKKNSVLAPISESTKILAKIQALTYPNKKNYNFYKIFHSIPHNLG